MDATSCFENYFLTPIGVILHYCSIKRCAIGKDKLNITINSNTSRFEIGVIW